MKAHARVSFFDVEGNLVLGPMFEVESTNRLAEIKMVEIFFGDDTRCEGDFYEAAPYVGDGDADLRQRMALVAARRRPLSARAAVDGVPVSSDPMASRRDVRRRPRERHRLQLSGTRQRGPLISDTLDAVREDGR